MDNPAENGHVSFIGTIVLGVISWLTPENIDLGFKIITGIGAFVSAVLASRYYWYAAKEKKKALDDKSSK